MKNPIIADVNFITPFDNEWYDRNLSSFTIGYKSGMFVRIAKGIYSYHIFRVKEFSDSGSPIWEVIYASHMIKQEGKA
jgi:hypothetical protein